MSTTKIAGDRGGGGHPDGGHPGGGLHLNDGQDQGAVSGMKSQPIRDLNSNYWPIRLQHYWAIWTPGTSSLWSLGRYVDLCIIEKGSNVFFWPILYVETYFLTTDSSGCCPWSGRVPAGLLCRWGLPSTWPHQQTEKWVEQIPSLNRPTAKKLHKKQRFLWAAHTKHLINLLGNLKEP